MRSRITIWCWLLSVGLVSSILSCNIANNAEIPGDNYYIKYYGEDGDQTAIDMVVNADGSIVMLGKSNTGNSRIFVTKVNSSGKIIWQKKFGGSTDDPKDIEPKIDGSGYVILSDYQEPSNNSVDAHLTVISNDGAENASVTHGSPADQNGIFHNDYSKSLTALSDGGYIIAGYSDFDWLSHSEPHNSSASHFRCDSNLNFYTKIKDGWNENSGSGKLNGSTKAIQTGDSIYVFGYTNYDNSNNINQKIFIKYNSFSFQDAGGINLVGEKNTNDDDQPNFVMYAPSQLLEGFFITSTINENGVEPRLHVLKLKNPLYFNNTDDIQFNRTINDGSFSTRKVEGVASSVSLTVPEGYLIAGNEFNETGQRNILLMKINQEGKEVWSANYGGSKDDLAAAVTELPDGKILILATVQLDIQFKIALLKVNSRGQFLK